MQTDNDLELLRKIADDDPDALQELYQQHGGRILNYLKGKLYDKGLAEEVLQDVMYVVWEGAASFRGECKVRTWMYSIARNKAREEIRRHKLDTVPIHNTDAITMMNETLTQIFRRDVLTRVFRKLSAEHREVIELKFYHSLKIAEISFILGIPDGTVKTRLLHAKQQMRRLLESEGITHA